MKNTIYPRLRKHIKEHHGFSKEELKKTDLWKSYEDYMNHLKSFDRKRVEIDISAEIDWYKEESKKKGRILIKDDSVMFFEGRRTRKYFNLDAGLFDGFYNTLIVKNIKAI